MPTCWLCCDPVEPGTYRINGGHVYVEREDGWAEVAQAHPECFEVWADFTGKTMSVRA
jgi:hypothetical protein